MSLRGVARSYLTEVRGWVESGPFVSKFREYKSWVLRRPKLREKI